MELLESLGPRPSQAGSGNSICLAGRRGGAYFRICIGRMAIINTLSLPS
jgi:hypothetical protein